MKNEDQYLKNVKKYLRSNLSKEDFEELNFKKAIATKFHNGKIYVLRVQFKKSENEFVLVRTDEIGTAQKA